MKKLRLSFLLLASIALFAVFFLIGCGPKDTKLYNPNETNQESAETTPEAKESELTTPAPTTTEAETTTEEESTEEETTTEPVTETPEQGEPLQVGAKWYVNSDVLNIRSGPSTEYEAVASLYRGEQILILAIEGEWLQIMSAAGDGYVNVNYVVSTYSETGLSGSAPKDPEEEQPADALEDNPEAAPEDNPEAAPEQGADNANANGHIVCIDAGHQQAGISEQEPNGPGSSVMKAKLTTGTSGCVTGLAEHELNLTVALALKQELLNRGYEVVMIRETADCPQSNAERAQVANASGAELFLRIHANSSDNSEVSGAQFYVPSAANPYMSSELVAASQNLGRIMLDNFCAATGATDRGLLEDDSMTGINWCTIPVTIAEMGFMSNPTEDQLMADASYQALMVQGFANGIDAYFGL